ncbi:MAG: galactokinase family protein [Spirochaetia bacterium]|jgi:galactokinase|nr:galactokinase family protein [Spirochaetia bacterium]
MRDIAAVHQTEYETPPLCIASAPAVIKMLGEHTADSEGIVLAAASSFEMKVAISQRKDASMRFFAADLGERKRASTGTLKYKREDRWSNNVKSIFDYFSRNFDVQVRGVNVTIMGDVPPGLGLGISAAINMATALALRTIYDLPIKNEDLAILACNAQSSFMEKPAPLYDYLTCISPGSRALSVIDLRVPRRRAVQFLDESWSLVLTDSRVPRMSAEQELKQRGEDCKRCLKFLSPRGDRTLRDIRMSELDDLMGVLPESVRRRCIHIIEETGRVFEAEEALARQDAPAFGRIFNKSHASLRNHYEISCPEVDWLVKRSLEIDGILCSRMTGPGFGGCIFSVMRSDALDEYKKRLEEYERIFGFKAQIYETALTGGMKIISN